MENELDNVIYFGDAVKAIELENGDVKLGGYLVRFSDPSTPDLTGDYFTPRTEFGNVSKSHSWFNHRQVVEFEGKTAKYANELPEADLNVDEIGVFAEIVIGARSQYEKIIAELGLAGKLCWSSGTASHLVDRKHISGDIFEITRWPLGLDASLTPTPAEPKNSVVPIKSLITALSADAEMEDAKNIIPVIEEVNMTEEEMKAMLEQVASDAADAAVKKYAAESQPDILAGVLIDVVGDESDRAAKGNPFKSAGEFFSAVKNAATDPSSIDKRLNTLKASGMNEAIPSQGGFLVTQDIASGIMTNMWGTGTVLSKFNPINVSGNGMVFNIVDEASRADGYRQGGILGYWLAEAGTKTATKPTFRQLSLKLKKVAALCYATDELLDDATALESWITNNVPTELRFQVEAAIINGNGVGKPQGILQSNAYYELARVDANEIDATDVSNMWAHRYLGANDYVWFINPMIFPQLQTMSVGQMPVYTPPGGFSAMPYGFLFGRPVIETEYNPSLGISGDILLASPSQYALISKGGVQTASSIHVQFVTDETAFRFVYRVDGASTWNAKVPSYYASSDYFSPFVGLLASS